MANVVNPNKAQTVSNLHNVIVNGFNVCRYPVVR